MFDFLLGFLLGSGTRGGRVTWRDLGVAFVVLMILSGFGYFVLGVFTHTPEAAEASASACSKQVASSFELAFCSLTDNAFWIGSFLLAVGAAFVFFVL